MTPLYRLLCFGYVATTFAFTCQAQTPSKNTPIPSESTLENWLRSGDPRLEAWGAHDALVTHDQNLTPYLLSLVSKWQPLVRICDGSRCSDLSPEQMDERDAIAAALDALIQMKVSVPANDLRNLAPDFGDYVAILLARLPDEESANLSLDFYRASGTPNYALQYVSAALLALHPPPGFAADLLGSIKVSAAVLATVPGPEPPRSGFATSCGAYIIEAREDWPEIGQYGLFRHGSNAAFLVMRGDVPIYASRQDSPRYINFQCSRAGSLYLSPDDRFRLIAEMLGASPGAMQWRTAIETKIEYKSPKQFDAALLALVNEQQQMYRATAKALSERNLMTPSEVETSLPELDLEVEDMRGPDPTPIPMPTNLPPRVGFSYSYW